MEIQLGSLLQLMAHGLKLDLQFRENCFKFRFGSLLSAYFPMILANPSSRQYSPPILVALYKAQVQL